MKNWIVAFALLLSFEPTWSQTTTQDSTSDFSKILSTPKARTVVETFFEQDPILAQSPYVGSTYLHHLGVFRWLLTMSSEELATQLRIDKEEAEQVQSRARIVYNTLEIASAQGAVSDVATNLLAEININSAHIESSPSQRQGVEEEGGKQSGGFSWIERTNLKQSGIASTGVMVLIGGGEGIVPEPFRQDIRCCNVGSNGRYTLKGGGAHVLFGVPFNSWSEGRLSVGAFLNDSPIQSWLASSNLEDYDQDSAVILNLEALVKPVRFFQLMAPYVGGGLGFATDGLWFPVTVGVDFKLSRSLNLLVEHKRFLPGLGRALDQTNKIPSTWVRSLQAYAVGLVYTFRDKE
ncbi:MAG: hypothetical protein HY402_07145 [Elusimicrobia bacterium]|nr:hypothetical protein [Elusimicrobiota bacterium]